MCFSGRLSWPAALLYHLVRSGEQSLRDGEPERLDDPAVDYELELVWSLNRPISGLCPP